MDPLSALSLAANIVQFVELGVKLIAVGGQVRASGSSEKVLDLSLVATDFRNVNAKLKSNVKLSSLFGSVSEDEQALETLVDNCIKIGDDLAAQLKSLRLDDEAPTKWRIVQKSLKLMWNENSLDGMVRRMESIRAEAEFRLVAITKGKVDAGFIQMDQRFGELDAKSQEIIQTLLKGTQATLTAIERQTVEAHRRHDQTDTLITKLHEETLDAINQANVAMFEQAIEIPDDLHDDTIPRVELSDKQVAEKILAFLRFEQMYEREEEVESAHPKTFQWVLDDQAAHVSGRLFQPLTPWLRAGEGCYWINGKAGSGKSTLMKCIKNDKRILTALKSWALTGELIIASFFFWRSGSSLQRSQEGLLRWLLLTILSKRKDLVPTCFPLVSQALKQGSQLSNNFTLESLQNAFLRLSMQNTHDMKIFLLIDGVDEFEGNHTQISRFFFELGQTSSFKVLISSRPIQACTTVFGTCDSLRLQDLTRDDIKSFVDSTIGSHPHLKVLRAERPSETSDLLDSILTKAAGVFLWVRLVTKSLSEGIENYDRVEELQERVNEIPSELEELYMHMFRSMNPRYQANASQLLQLTCRSIVAQTIRPLTVLQLSLADEHDPIRSCKKSSHIADIKEVSARCEAMSGRIKLRCCGLVEVQNLESTAKATTDITSTAEDESQQPPGGWNVDEVHVLHASVFSFLQGPKIWNTLTALTPRFDSNLCLIAACVSELKILNSQRPLQCLTQAYTYARLSESETGEPPVMLLEELNKAILSRVDVWEITPVAFSDGDIRFTRGDPDFVHRTRLFFFMATRGVPQYLQWQLANDTIDIRDKIDYVAIMAALTNTIIPVTVEAVKASSRSDPALLIERCGEALLIMFDYAMQRERLTGQHGSLRFYDDLLGRVSRLQTVLPHWTTEMDQYTRLKTITKVLQKLLEKRDMHCSMFEFLEWQPGRDIYLYYSKPNQMVYIKSVMSNISSLCHLYQLQPLDLRLLEAQANGIGKAIDDWTQNKRSKANYSRSWLPSTAFDQIEQDSVPEHRHTPSAMLSETSKPRRGLRKYLDKFRPRSPSTLPKYVFELPGDTYFDQHRPIHFRA